MSPTPVFVCNSMSDVTKADSQGCGSGALLDDFGVLIQARPTFRSGSHLQAIGALFIHFANVFLSTLTIEDPCSLYLMNFLLDATLGMLVIWVAVKAVSKVVASKQFTLLTFGEYGDPPQATAWVAQCVVYLLIMVLEKTVVSLVLLIPGWTEVLLDYIPNPQLELALVMLIVPFFVNAIMFWVVDSLMMRKYNKSLATIKGSCDTGKQGESSPLSSEESQVREKKLSSVRNWCC
uniref:Transmembrane protein 110, like n=1 Tax=Scleropages formosus TaxID=113540 RepID=A0A8C9ST90_SCLFO